MTDDPHGIWAANQAAEAARKAEQEAAFSRNRAWDAGFHGHDYFGPHQWSNAMGRAAKQDLTWPLSPPKNSNNTGSPIREKELSGIGISSSEQVYKTGESLRDWINGLLAFFVFMLIVASFVVAYLYRN